MLSSTKGLRSLCGILVAVLALGLVVANASAATPATTSKGGISISPPLKEIIIGPGLVQATTDVVVTNNTGQDVQGTVRAVDFKALDAFGGISLGQAGIPLSKYGLANWMTIATGNTVSLPKGSSATVKVHIDNRSDLTPGGHYGAVVVTASKSESGSGNRVNLKQELVSLIFLKKLGGEQYGLQLQSMTVVKGTSIPATASLRFKSTGNVHVVPRGYVTVTDPKGKLVAKGFINQESTIIMPGTTRQFETLLQPIASSTATGKYAVTAKYRYDGKNSFDTATIYYQRGSWWSPLHSTAVGVLVLVIGVAYMVVRSSRKRRFR